MTQPHVLETREALVPYLDTWRNRSLMIGLVGVVGCAPTSVPCSEMPSWEGDEGPPSPQAARIRATTMGANTTATRRAFMTTSFAFGAPECPMDGGRTVPFRGQDHPTAAVLAKGPV